MKTNYPNKMIGLGQGKNSDPIIKAGKKKGKKEELKRMLYGINNTTRST